MERLCERPGCSDVASVMYGMRPADLVFWLDALTDAGDGSGVLCRRHADSMVVPRDWTLDDLRDPDLRLFRPPAPVPTPARSRRATRTRTAADQLDLGIAAGADGVAPVATVAAAASGDAPAPGGERALAPTDGSAADGWTPSFDDDDDLGGLLSARSPLLARAFRGDGRPRRS